MAIKLSFKDKNCVYVQGLRSYLVVVFVVAMFSLIGSAFADAEFSIILPQNWIQKPGIQYAYANSDVEGNYILIDSESSPKNFGSRDDFHGFIKSTEYAKAGFGLGKSITTISTDYGYKSVIELKLKKSDGNTMTLRKDYHYSGDDKTLFEIHGYSSDFGTKSELIKTLNTFRPL